MNKWSATVIRVNEEKGHGALYLYKDFELYDKYNCITGGDIKDPFTLSGLTPPLNWIMIEPIQYRKHPRGHMMDMARIIPVGLGKTIYHKRTYAIDQVPFMIHKAGRSTGCIAIAADQWEEAKKAINSAWAEDTFIISVRD